MSCPGLNQLTGGSIVLLPSELVDSILSRLPVQELIHLREVCKLWQNVIEQIKFFKRKSLILMDYPQTITFREGLTRRFFGEIDLNTFVSLKLKRSRNPEFVVNFRALLLRLFPILEQLVLAFWTVADPAFVFNIWPSDQLTTLSLNLNGALVTHLQMDQLLPRVIASCTHLKRLDLDTLYDKLPALASNLTRLEHLSCSHRRVTAEWHWDEFMSRFINEDNCTRFCNQVREADYAEVFRWNRVADGHWLNRLTHLALFVNASVEPVVNYLSVEATSLRVLHLKHTVTSHNMFTLDLSTIRNLARLAHLEELELDWMAVNLSSLDAAAQRHQLATLEHIRVCRLTIYRIIDRDGDPTTTGERFVWVISIILPNVEQLNIAYH